MKATKSITKVNFLLVLILPFVLYSDPEPKDPFLQKTCEILKRIQQLDMFEIDADSAVSAYDLTRLLETKRSLFPEIANIQNLLDPFETICRKINRIHMKALVEGLYDLDFRLRGNDSANKILQLIQELFDYLYKETARQSEIAIQERKRMEAIEAMERSFVTTEEVDPTAFDRGVREAYQRLGIGNVNGERVARGEEKQKGRDVRYPHWRRGRAR